MPVSAAKNALLVSRALVPNLTSLNAILVMPNAIDKTILENVTAKSSGNVYIENLDFTYTNQ